VFPKHFGIACLGILPAFAPVAQATQAPPQVKVNVLNVCTPSADEQKEIDSALAKVPKEPAFTPDFEVARGRSTLSDNDIIKAGGSSTLAPEAIAAAWVRMRRDFSTPPFSSVQYSFSADSNAGKQHPGKPDSSGAVWEAFRGAGTVQRVGWRITARSERV